MTPEWSDFETIRDGRPGERVLDQGYVILVDHMGDDGAIVQAARISTAKGTKSPAEDRALIRYLMRNHHGTPFEMVEFKFLVKCPMFVWRQWIRHRTASVNEMSGRYVALPEDFFIPKLGAVRDQSTSMKQGRADVVSQHAATFLDQYEHEVRGAFRVYKDAVEHGIGKEVARIGLPLSTYTVAYWKANLRNLFHFLGLRLDTHAQEEIRVYAQAMERLVRPLVPYAYEAFEDFELKATTLSAVESRVLAAASRNIAHAETWAGGLRLLSVAAAECGMALTTPSGKPSSEWTELLAKVKRLGFMQLGPGEDK